MNSYQRQVEINKELRNKPGEADTLRRAVVTDNKDIEHPELLRHTTTAGDKGGAVDLAPANRLLPAPHWSPPQYPVGSTVQVGAIAGDPHNLVCLGTELNKANQAPYKEDPVLDDSRYIPGAKALVVAGKEIRKVDGGIAISVGTTRVLIESDGTVKISAKSIQLDARETIVSGDLVVQGDSDLLGQTAITGKEACVVGGTDDRGHKFENSGQLI